MLAIFLKKPIMDAMNSPLPTRKPIVSAAKKLVYLVAALLVIAWLSYTPAGLLGKADALGYAVCHRFEFHSFMLGERQLPLCARCSGMYLGAVLGLLYFSILHPRKAGYPHLKTWLVLGLFALGFAWDGVNSFLGMLITDTLAQINPGLHQALSSVVLYQTQNWTRLLSGSGMGLVMASMLYPAFNQTAWKEVDLQPALSGFSSLAPLVGLGLLLDLLVLSENPIVLYPLALISAIGVLLLLGLIYTMILLMAFRHENRYDTLRQMAFPLAAGFGLALLQILLIDWARFSITQTWGGFPLP